MVASSGEFLLSSETEGSIMIQKEIIDLIASRIKVNRRELIEKDLILHRLLVELSSERYFFENYAFKGGTCLITCYFDYYRFSEDLDFTYINQTEFNNKSEKQKRSLISKKIDQLLDILMTISHRIGLDFKKNKNSAKYMEFGGSNKQITFKLWYASEESYPEIFIKIQINFLENLEYPIIEQRCDNFIFGRLTNFDSAFLLPESSEWIQQIPKMLCYDLREILVEKIRAILTRKGAKARDYIDVYMIAKREKFRLREFKKQIITKVSPILKFEKYKNNFSEKRFTELVFNRAEEERILLIDLPKDFDTFFEELKIFLEEISQELEQK